MSETIGQSGAGEVRDVSRFMPLMPLLIVAGLVAIGAAAGVAFIGDDAHHLKRLGLAYLTGFSVFLTVSIGALFFVIIQHLTRAGWSVTVRRLAEAMSMNLVTMFVLSIPILASTGVIYHWTHPEGDAILESKTGWLNTPFWVARMSLYFALWIGMAFWFWRNSVRQDRTGEVSITEKLQSKAGLMVVVFALSVNFGYIDLLMTLDPHWYSTMFGVYCFAGSFLNFMGVSILILRFLQSRGIVTRSVTLEHYHDMGKFMFAFIFFWSYVAFSQWMLIWYANIPEETAWFAKRGATTDEVWTAGVWGWVALSLLLFHCLFPFAGMLSRWAKRILKVLTFWAIWMPVMHFVDLFWLVMPEVSKTMEQTTVEAHFGKSLAMALLCAVGVGCIWLGGLIYFASRASLVPTQDPRLNEALGYEVY